jgi:hypothetical protein
MPPTWDSDKHSPLYRKARDDIAAKNRRMRRSNKKSGDPAGPPRRPTGSSAFPGGNRRRNHRLPLALGPIPPGKSCNKAEARQEPARVPETVPQTGLRSDRHHLYVRHGLIIGPPGRRGVC